MSAHRTNATLLENELVKNWGVDFSEGGGVVWKSTHSFLDGYVSMHVLDVDPDHGELRVYRAFPLGATPSVSVDVDMSLDEAMSADIRSTAYNTDARGDVAGWREAVVKELSSDVVFLWHHDDAPLFSFIARTARVGAGERIVCGQCQVEGNNILVQVQKDLPLSALLPSANRAASPSMRIG